jgi:two-component sensor histidine kinase
MAEAVAMSDRTAVLRTSIAQIENLVENKDRLLEHKKMLAEELLHRVRNNLQLICGMLTRQRDFRRSGPARRAGAAL